MLILTACHNGPDIDCADKEAAQLGLNIAAETFPEIAPELEDAAVICATLEQSRLLCGFGKAPKKLDGCTPFSGSDMNPTQRGRIVVVEGRVCPTVIHEAVHWLDMSMGHTDPKWPVEAERVAKAKCDTMK